MAANLTPQYLKAEEEYRRAATTEDEIKWLETMLREMPKHKASEKLQCDLKTKISKAKKDLEVERKSGKKGPSVRILRQGAGTVVVLGGPNAGKSRLVTALTRATPEVAPYPFTTRTATPGMMPWEDVSVQLIDTPPITADFLETYMQGMIRSADTAILMVDLGADDGIEHCQALVDRLNATKTRLAATSRLDEEDVGLSYTQTLLVPNKIDDPDATVRLDFMHELLLLDLPELVISAETGQGIAELKAAIYKSLDVVRVYTKTPTAKEPDMTRPFTLRRGSTLADLAGMIHQDFVAKLKSARIWGTAVHDASTVKPDYVLHDKDVAELHV
ncbi:MAG: GTPase [Planctomycetia bacterium]|nr:GTPase [Planctomycetia bacterium]